MPKQARTSTHAYSSTKVTLRYALALTVAATAAFLAVSAYLVATGHGLLWRPDGNALYYTAYVFAGELLRDAFASIMAGSLPSFSPYTFFQGYGSDYILTMGNTLINPLNISAFFFTPEHAEFGYYLTIWLRYLLAGFAFSFYCFNRGKGYRQTLVGALAYLLCGYFVFWAILRHGMFLDIAIFMPLAFLGIDRLFEGRHPFWLVAALAFSFLLSVYFTYMLCFFILAYSLVKYFFAPRARSISDFLLLASKAVAYAFTGLAIGAVLGIPNVIQMLSLGRVSQESAVPLFQMPSYYLGLPSNFVGSFVDIRGLFIGVVSLALIAVFISCKRYYDAAERKSWLVALVLCLVAACFPWFGHAINGFGYVTDRWMVLAGFVVAYIVCITVPAVGKLSKREARNIAIVLFALLAIAGAAAVVVSGLGSLVATLAFAAILAITIRLLCSPCRFASASLCVLLILNAGIASTLDLSELGDSYAKEFEQLGAAYEATYLSSPAAAVAPLLEDSSYRFSAPTINTRQANNGIIPQIMGISFYASFYNQGIDDLRDGLGIYSNHKNYLYAGNDGRFALEVLSGARYEVVSKGNAWKLPATYTDTSKGNSSYSVYESNYALPLAISYENALSRESYEALDMVSKQEALLSGIVLEDSNLSLDPAPSTSAVSPAYTLEPDEGVQEHEGQFVVTKPNSGFTLTFDGLAEAETYLCMVKPSYTAMSSWEADQINGEDSPRGLLESLRYSIFQTPTMYALSVSCVGNEQGFNLTTPAYTTYVERSGICANLGYSRDAKTSVHLSFERIGTYSFEDLSVICQPVAPLMERATALKEAAATDVSLGKGTLAAHFDNVEAGTYALVTIPYTQGWHARLDGEPVEVLKGNVGFCAVQMQEAGTHDLELYYKQPGADIGLLAFVGGLIALAASIVLYLRRKGSARTNSSTIDEQVSSTGELAR